MADLYMPCAAMAHSTKSIQRVKELKIPQQTSPLVMRGLWTVVATWRMNDTWPRPQADCEKQTPFTNYMRMQPSTHSYQSKWAWVVLNTQSRMSCCDRLHPNLAGQTANKQTNKKLACSWNYAKGCSLIRQLSHVYIVYILISTFATKGSGQIASCWFSGSCKDWYGNFLIWYSYGCVNNTHKWK